MYIILFCLYILFTEVGFNLTNAAEKLNYFKGLLAHVNVLRLMCDISSAAISIQ